MGTRFHPEKMKSQIVFDITGGEPGYTTMALSSIPNERRFVRTGEDDHSLRTDDIEGARAKPNRSKTRDHTLNVSDIDGARPSTSYNTHRPPVDLMSVDDIDGAQPRIHRNLPHSQRHTNPLNPDYQLPEVAAPPPPELPFLYDGMNYDDIPGVHPRSYKTDKAPRDVMKVSDIPGAQQRPRIRPHGSPGRDTLDVTDINTQSHFCTKRRTNPLTPVYEFGGQVLAADYGGPQSSYLKRLDGRDLSLRTDDIDGAQGTPAMRPRTAAPADGPEETMPLMLPSMHKQTAELERQKAIDKARSDRIYRFEHRHLQRREGTDAAQNAIKRQRAAADPHANRLGAARHA
jgi:hypothetical protein